MTDTPEPQPAPPPSGDQVAAARLNGVLFAVIGLLMAGFSLWRVFVDVESTAAEGAAWFDAVLRSASLAWVTAPFGAGMVLIGLRMVRKGRTEAEWPRS